jgi:hypothetical protein
MRHFTGQRWFIRSQGGIPMSDSMSLVGAKYYPKTGKKRLDTTVCRPVAGPDRGGNEQPKPSCYMDALRCPVSARQHATLPGGLQPPFSDLVLDKSGIL